MAGLSGRAGGFRVAEVPVSPQTGGSAPVERRQPNRAVVVAVVAVFVLAVVAMAFLGYRSFQKRLTAARAVDRATEVIERADKRVAEIDAVVRARVTASLAAQARGAAESVPTVRAQLDDAIQLIDGAMLDLTDDERERATLLRRTAEARLAMLSRAPGILELNAQAASALPLADPAWEAIISADTLSDRAVKSYNKLTKAGVQQSRTLNRQAEAKLTVARQGFEAAEEAFPAAPFEMYLAYVDARVSLNKMSRQSDEAWLSGKIERANELAAQYNRKDKQAAEQAKQLAESPEAAIATAFAAAVKPLESDYFAARDRALEADRQLEQY